MHETPYHSQRCLSKRVQQALKHVQVRNRSENTFETSRSRLKRERGLRKLLTVGSVFEGRVDGVCMMLIFALRKKSAEPPKPFNILEPMTQVELAWAYISLSLCQLRVIAEGLSETYTSTGVFIPMTPNRRMISGELDTCCERKSSFPA